MARSGHFALLNGLDADPLERLGEFDYLGRAVELATILRPPVQAKIEAIGLVEVALPACACYIAVTVPCAKADRRKTTHFWPVGAAIMDARSGPSAVAAMDAVACERTAAFGNWVRVAEWSRAPNGPASNKRNSIRETTLAGFGLARVGTIVAHQPLLPGMPLKGPARSLVIQPP